jgi:DUF1707 SHOCT-like domain
MAGPGDEVATAEGRSHGWLRASHADREQVIGILKAAFVQGMLAKDEFDQRVGQGFEARTHADLAALTADIPAGLPAGQPPREPARAENRPTMSTEAKEGIVVAIAILVPAILTFATGSPLVFLLFTPFYFTALVATGAQVFFSSREKRSRGQLPSRPDPA